MFRNTIQKFHINFPSIVLYFCIMKISYKCNEKDKPMKNKIHTSMSIE